MTDDVVAELDRWLDRNPVNDRVLTLAALVQRARDEIVGLREALAGALAGREMTRNVALEEAARLCEGAYPTGSTASTLKAMAKAIRALKER